MAYLLPDEFARKEMKQNSISSKTIGTYTSFDYEGKHYFQINTYGAGADAEERRKRGKSSQNLQIDEEGAKIMVELLKREFHLD